MSFIDSSATRDLLNPSSRRDDRITRLEAQVAFLADRLGVSPDELDRHGEKPMPEEVARLVAQGKKLPAIKAYRQATGASLRGAKRAVDGVG